MDYSNYGNLGLDPLSQFLMGPNQFTGAIPTAPTVQPPMTQQAPPVNPMQTAMFNGGQQPPQTNPMQPITIDAWRPHAETFLGRLADALLGARGMAPGFKNANDQRNMQAAMEGFVNDPMQVAQRLARIPGHEGDALKMAEQLHDDDRMQGTLDRQNRVLDLRNDDAINQMVAGMMMRATPDTWKTMRDLAIKRAQNRGYTGDIESLIPPEYDADSINYMVGGVVKPKDQMTDTTRNRSITVREHHDTAMETQNATNEEGRNARFNTGQAGTESRFERSQAGTESRFQRSEAGRNARSAHPKPQVIHTPHGEMVLDPSGTRGQIGDQLWQKVAPGQWKRVK